MDMIKLGFGYTKDAIKFILCLFAPSNIKNTFNTIRGMTPRDIIVGFFRLHFRLAYMLLMFLFTIFWWVSNVLVMWYVYVNVKVLFTVGTWSKVLTIDLTPPLIQQPDLPLTQWSDPTSYPATLPDLKPSDLTWPITQWPDLTSYLVTWPSLKPSDLSRPVTQRPDLNSYLVTWPGLLPNDLTQPLTQWSDLTSSLFLLFLLLLSLLITIVKSNEDRIEKLI